MVKVEFNLNYRSKSLKTTKTGKEKMTFDGDDKSEIVCLTFKFYPNAAKRKFIPHNNKYCDIKFKLKFSEQIKNILLKYSIKTRNHHIRFKKELINQNHRCFGPNLFIKKKDVRNGIKMRNENTNEHGDNIKMKLGWIKHIPEIENTKQNRNPKQTKHNHKWTGNPNANNIIRQ